VIAEVAKHLRNTPAVCRKSYIDPVVLDAWEAGRLHAFTKDVRGQRQWEQALLRFLRRSREQARRSGCPKCRCRHAWHLFGKRARGTYQFPRICRLAGQFDTHELGSIFRVDRFAGPHYLVVVDGADPARGRLKGNPVRPARNTSKANSGAAPQR
jgi:hypothetical protein